MPMHPECRQEDLEKHGFNAAISMFLPMTALEGKREYMSRYYTPELEAEEAAEREQRFLALVEDWAQRRRQAEDAGQAFDEPFPRYPEPAERPEPLWERVVGEGLYRLSCLPGGKYITFAAIIIGVALTCWIVLPWYVVNVQRQWRSMLRRDREYEGDAVCDHCGGRFRRSPRPAGGKLPGH